MYSRRSFRFVRSDFLSISCCSLSCMSIACALLVLNIIFQYFVLHVFRYFVNHIIPLFQFTSRLCLTNQPCPRNISMPFKSITTASNCSLCPLILILSDTNCVTSLFLVPSVLKNSNDISVNLILIYSSLTSYLLIPVQIHPKSTSIYSYNSFLFYVLILACIFSSFSLLFCQ